MPYSIFQDRDRTNEAFTFLGKRHRHNYHITLIETNCNWHIWSSQARSRIMPQAAKAPELLVSPFLPNGHLLSNTLTATLIYTVIEGWSSTCRKMKANVLQKGALRWKLNENKLCLNRSCIRDSINDTEHCQQDNGITLLDELLKHFFYKQKTNPWQCSIPRPLLLSEQGKGVDWISIRRILAKPKGILIILLFSILHFSLQ